MISRQCSISLDNNVIICGDSINYEEGSLCIEVTKGCYLINFSSLVTGDSGVIVELRLCVNGEIKLINGSNNCLSYLLTRITMQNYHNFKI